MSGGERTNGGHGAALRTYVWEPAADKGIEHLVLRLGPGGFEAEGLVVRLAASGPVRLRYRLSGDAHWRTRRVEAEIAGPPRRRVALVADGEGCWLTGRRRQLPALAGCIDVDIAATPFTNTLSIRRLLLRTNASAEVLVACIRVPDLEVLAVPQRYTRLADDDGFLRYRYENVSSGFTADLTTDGEGVVVEYPGQWRQIGRGERAMTNARDTLIEKDGIVECITRLFVGTDARDWESVRACFADTVHFDMTSLAGGQPAELAPADIVQGWEKGLRPLAAVHHQAGNYLVDVRDRTATATCYATATHYRPTASGRNVRTFVGTYDFSLAKRGGRWRITGFRFNLKYMDGNRDLESDGE